MNDDRLTRPAIMKIVLAGLVTAVVALVATFFVVGTTKSTYTARAQVALVPGKQLPASDVPSYWEALGGGQAARIASEVFQQSQWRDVGAKAAGVTPSAVTVTAGVVTDTSLINVTVESTSAQGAEAAADKIIADATPLVVQVSGPFELKVVQSAAGTAVPSSISPIQIYIVVFLGALLVGAGAALMVIRSKARSDAEDDRYSAGEYTPPPAAYGRPAGPPPRGVNEQPRGVNEPRMNERGPMNGANGNYGPPPRQQPVEQQRPAPQR